MSVEKQIRSIVSEAGKKVLEFPWESQSSYAVWLAQTYYLVRHTTRFLALAAARVPVESRETHYKLLRHLKEESNHDLPLLKDLAALGESIDSIPELTETRLIRNNQYYWLEYGTPAALDGYALLLEGLSVSVCPTMVERIRQHGHGDAVSFLKLHIEVDQDHFADGIKRILDLSPQEQKDMLQNLDESSYMYLRMLSGISEKAAARPILLKKAA